jgi:hypothetical protein
MRFARCIPKATNTHSQYILLIAVPQQRWLHKSVSFLCHMYLACPVVIIIPLQDLTDIGVNESAELNTLIYIYIFVYLFVVL